MESEADRDDRVHRPVRRLLVVAVVLFLLAGLGLGLADTGSPSHKGTPTAATGQVSSCYRNLRSAFPEARVPRSTMIVILATVHDGDPITAVSLGVRHLGWYCISSEYGPFDLAAGPHEVTNAVQLPKRGIRVMSPFWLGDFCRSRDWVVMAQVPLDVTSVTAVTKTGAFQAPVVKHLAAVFVTERPFPRGVASALPFGTLLGFDARGALVATAGIYPFELEHSRPEDTCSGKTTTEG